MQFVNLWLKKTDGCKNDPDNASTTKVDEHILCGYSISTIWAFDSIQNFVMYTGKDWSRLHEKVLETLKKAHNDDNCLWKKKVIKE